jgi:hypothetical protein
LVGKLHATGDRCGRAQFGIQFQQAEHGFNSGRLDGMRSRRKPDDRIGCNRPGTAVY